MKNLIIYFSIFMGLTKFNAQCNNFTQTPYIPYNSNFVFGVDGHYYTDRFYNSSTGQYENVFQNFEGHYKYQNGNTSFELKLIRKAGATLPGQTFCYDILVGGYKYIKNGILEGDDLNNGLLNLQYAELHRVDGNSILLGNIRGCVDCSPNETRVELTISDLHSGTPCNLYIRKINHNGQEALKVLITVDLYFRTKKYDDPPLLDIKLPLVEEMILIKQ